MQVVGVGGGGSNAVNRMLESQLIGVELMVMNTDAQVRGWVLGDDRQAPPPFKNTQQCRVFDGSSKWWFSALRQ